LVEARLLLNVAVNVFVVGNRFLGLLDHDSNQHQLSTIVLHYN
ncbi:537_t:CDS:2, partial [Gigaspora rosea]